MTTRTLALTLALCTAAAGLVFAQPPAAPQPGSAPRARTPSPTPDAQRPRMAVPPEATPPPPPPPPAPTTGAPRRTGQPLNIRVDVTVTDQRAGAPAVKKTISIVTADAMGGRIRSQVSFTGPVGDVPLNIDTEPTILADGKIRVVVNLQYDLPGIAGNEPAIGGAQRKTQIQENLALVLESGKPLIAAQSADPVGDRQVTVEVKATILR